LQKRWDRQTDGLLTVALRFPLDAASEKARYGKYSCVLAARNVCIRTPCAHVVHRLLNGREQARHQLDIRHERSNYVV